MSRRTHSPQADFSLRFPLRDLSYWSEQYNYASRGVDPELVGNAARTAGYLTLKQFRALGAWKSQRVSAWHERNAAPFVKEVTRTAFASADPRLKIEVLTLLDGVRYPTASAILHFCDKGSWPIIDFRALWSLGQEVPTSGYTFELWAAYTQHTRELASQAKLTMRTVDRALWAYSKKHQPSKAD